MAEAAGQHHLHEHICKNHQATSAETNLLASLATAEHVQAARSAAHEPCIDGTVATTSPANPMVRMVPQNDPRHSDQLEANVTVKPPRPPPLSQTLSSRCALAVLTSADPLVL